MEIKPGINLRVFGKAFSSVCIILLAFMLMTPGHSTAQEISESDWLSITIYGGSIAVKAFSDDSKVISIDVVNPEDEIIHFETQGTWIALPYEVMQLNGHYQLEVQMVDKESGEIVDRLAGDFIIENGSVITRKRESPSSKWLPNQLGIFLKGIARTVTGLLVSEAQAADLFASGDNPTVFFDDTSNGASAWGPNDWRLFGNTATSGNVGYFTLYNNRTGTYYIDIYDAGVNGVNSFTVDGNGNTGFANFGMYFNRGQRRLGIGTSSPTHMVDVVGNSRIRIRESTSATADTLDIRTDGAALDIEAINDNLWIHAGPTKDIFLQPFDTNRNVGIGTVTPTEKLHVRRYGSNTVGDGLSKVALLSAYNTSNLSGDSSDVGFALLNERSAFQWNFRTVQGTEGFAATKEGTGGTEFTLHNPTMDYHNVSLTMGNGASCTSTGQWLNASSRDYKENIQEISAQEALATLKQLNPVKYNFKKDDSKDLNLGFIAEDVPDLVATQDRKTISPIEMVAVLTKVVKEQQEHIKMLSEKIDKLANK